MLAIKSVWNNYLRKHLTFILPFIGQMIHEDAGKSSELNGSSMNADCVRSLSGSKMLKCFNLQLRLCRR